MKNAHFNSDGNSMRFVTHPSKTGFSAFPIKTAVHRAQYFQPCGRHRFTRILILLKNMNNHAVFCHAFDYCTKIRKIRMANHPDLELFDNMINHQMTSQCHHPPSCFQ